MTETKRFHLGDVLSITNGRLITPRGMDAIYDILSWMTGENLFTHQLPRAMESCEPFLKAQFPDSLCTEEIAASIQSMCDTLPGGKGESEKTQREKIIGKWLADASPVLGEWFDVKKIPAGENGPRDPIQEAVEMFGADKVVVAEVDRKPTP